MFAGWRRWVLVLGACGLVFAATVWAAGQQSAGPDGAPVSAADGERLGPEAGDRVEDYRARAATTLADTPDRAPRVGLVEFAAPADAAAAAAVLAGTGARAVRVVFRVPLPQVQTALRPQDLSSADTRAAVAAAQLVVGDEAAQQAGSPASAGRAAQVAAVEAPRLRAGCACVLALLVRADPAAARAVAARPGVRVVSLAPPGARTDRIAVSPLLPEQTDVVGPVPDDGPLPAP